MSELEEERNHGRIIPINIEDEMKTAYIDYSMSVIVSRAIPDVRDGFKPVHRRVMFGMHELGNHHNKPYKKSARIVGEVLGKYHPHGDTAVYDSMVRMAQEWSLRYPMVDGQGNYGSVDGDPPAAMRYTEARMSKIAEEMLADLEKETVDFQNNFDDTLKEPTVMPARIPNLLVNGTSGIAVGMATNMLPHNLTEAIDGCIAYIENREITIDELMEFVKAPDFPTGGTIYGIEGVREAFRTGRGKVVVRGKAEIENEGNRENIVITEIPYQVNKAKLHVQISELVNEGKIEGISDVRDESDRTGMRLVVELKRDAIPNVVLNRLFQYSQLQTSFGVNNIALVKGRPEMLNLKDMIRHFVEFRHEVVVRRTKFELAEAEKRAHILEGLIIAVNNIDEVIKIIRQSETSQIAQETLMSRFELSEIQTKAILEMRLRALTGLEIEKLRKEYDDIMALITHLKNILSDETLRYTIIKEELTEIKTKYGDKRKTDITFASGEINILDLIDNEQVVVTITHLGYMKRTSLAEYKEQSRGGKGSKGSNSREEDFIEHMFVAHTHNVLLLFTRNGRCHWLNVYEVPEGNKTSKGRAIQNILNISSEDKILAYIPIQNLSDQEYINNNYVMFCTKNGVIKKTLLEEFSRPRANGITALTIREGDELLEVVLTNGKMEVVLASLDGRALRFNESKIRSMGRSAAGVTGMDLGEINENNAIVGMVCVDKDSEEKQTILVVSEKGFGKRTYLDDPEDGLPIYRITNRGGKGVKTLNVTEKTGKVIAIKNVVDGDHLMIINKSGLAIRLKVSALRVIGRAAQGVTLIKLKGKDAIAAVAKVAAGDDDEDELVEGMEGDVNNIDNALQGGEEPEEFIDEPEIEETEGDSEEPGDDAGDE